MASRDLVLVKKVCVLPVGHWGLIRKFTDDFVIKMLYTLSQSQKAHNYLGVSEPFSQERKTIH